MTGLGLRKTVSSNTFVSHQLTSWSRVLVKLKVTQLLKKLYVFYETRGFMTCSQKPATGPYSGLDELSPHPSTLLLEDPS